VTAVTAAVDIVIVNWNSGTYLAECLQSIDAFGGDMPARTIVVDNGSTDGSVDARPEGPALVIHAGENLGFARACNVGAHRGSAPYILFLNPDARLLPGTIERALHFMDSPLAGNIGVCGVRLIGEQGQTQRCCARFPVWRTFVGRAIGLEGVFPGPFPAHYMTEFDHLSSREVDEVMGAFFLVRRSVFAQLDGFDERFFVYFEELDFCLRAKRAGWATWYLAEATAFHKGGGTSERVKALRLFYSLRSRIQYVLKHFSPAQALAVVGATLIIEPFARLFRAALRGSGAEAVDTIRGYAMIWRNLPPLFSRRSWHAPRSS
jgi:GT2 family glycosyltransferase